MPTKEFFWFGKQNYITVTLHYIISTELVGVLSSLVFHVSLKFNELIHLQLHYIIVFEFIRIGIAASLHYITVFELIT